jgi:putative hydrolase of the HAD superfamily
MTQPPATSRRFDALLLDIGDVITAPVFDQFDELEGHIGRTLAGRGPLDPSGDPPWQRFERGEINYYEYWEQYAERNGYDDWRLLFRELAVHLPHRFGDPEAYALMAEARAAGYKVGVLTNDGVGISGREYFDQFEEFMALDAFVDARAFGSKKPEPEPYLRAASALGTTPERVVFLDDAQYCIDGAHAVGMTGVLVDPLDKRDGFDRTRALLDLPTSTGTE